MHIETRTTIYPGPNGEPVELTYYEAGGWVFSMEDDGELDYAEEAVLAWTAWRDFLREKKNAE